MSWWQFPLVLFLSIGVCMVADLLVLTVRALLARRQEQRLTHWWRRV